MAGISTSAKWTQWNPEALYLLVSAANERAAQHLVDKAQDNLARGGHNDTGRLSRSFEINFSRYGGLGAEAEVTNTAPYAGVVDQGYDGLIYPTSANVLRFRPGKRKPRGSGGRFVSPAGFIYSPYVQGQAATHFFTNAVNSMSASDFL